MGGADEDLTWPWWRFELIHAISLGVFLGVVFAWPHVWYLGLLAGFGLEMGYLLTWLKREKEKESES